MVILLKSCLELPGILLREAVEMESWIGWVIGSIHIVLTSGPARIFPTGDHSDNYWIAIVTWSEVMIPPICS